VGGLLCWPSEPLYDQLVEGDALQRDGINLESYWTPWPDVESLTLERGRDFDLVVLGISVGALPFLCSELIAVNDDWRQMIERVKTVRTQAVQLWLRPDLTELGWAEASPVLTAFVEPMDTWADMSHLLVRETWEGEQRPANCAYFCGPMSDAEEPPFFTDPHYPVMEAAKVRETVLGFMEEHLGNLWPALLHQERREVSWGLLIDPGNAEGPTRLDAQFWRANIDPSERYVLSVAGSTKYRLYSERSGFTNLYLAGDWTRNGLNAGCVEAAVISGLQASRGISGYPAMIPGEKDRLPYSDTP